MNTKTDKEKAKAYDEVREKIAIRFGSNVAEEIFSEYEESEDERIRKWLIELVEEVRKANPTNVEYNGMCGEAIAWLEKQAEHAKFRDSIQVGDRVTRNEDGVLVNLSQLERVAKPAEKFPKYEKGDILTDGENKYEVLSWDYTETGIAAYYMKGVGCKFSWSCEEADKKLYIVEQKPADTEKGAKGNEREIPNSEPPLTIKHVREVIGIKQDDAWSEEDENAIQVLRDIVKHSNEINETIYTKPLKEKLYNWLNSIKDRVQPQNKWKESLATADLENSLCDIQDGFSDTSYEYRILGEAIEFIRCTEPKPRWKPSNEQMNALHDAAVYVDKSMFPYSKGILMKLYEQLKKLREE